MQGKTGYLMPSQTVTLFKHSHTNIFLFPSYTNTHTHHRKQQTRNTIRAAWVRSQTLARLVNLPFNLFAWKFPVFIEAHGVKQRLQCETDSTYTSEHMDQHRWPRDWWEGKLCKADFEDDSFYTACKHTKRVWHLSYCLNTKTILKICIVINMLKHAWQWLY